MIIGLSGKMTAGKDTVAGMLQYLSSDNPYIDYSPKIVVENVLNKSAIMKHSLWENKKFSYKLKQIASLLLGIPVDDLEKQEVKDKVLGEEWWYWNIFKTSQRVPYINNEDFDNIDFSVVLIKPTVRQILQEIGTDAIRNEIHPDAWVNALMSEYICGGIRAYPWTYCTCEAGECDYSNKYTPKWIITDVRFPNELQAVKDRNGIMIRINRPHGYTNPYTKEYKEVSLNFHPSETALDDAEFDYIIENDGSLEDLVDKVITITQNFKYKDEFKQF
jgi:hypothetical protein